MKRKMVYIGLSYIFGLFFASFFNFKGQILIISGIILAFVFICYILRMKAVHFIICAVVFISGFEIYNLYNTRVYRNIVNYNGQDVFYSGTVSDIKNYSNDKSLYKLSGKINSHTKADIIYYGDTLDCSYQDRLEFSCVMSQFENTFLFAQKDYYESSGFFLQTDKANDITIKENHGFSLRRTILDYRDKINNKISCILPDENGAVVTAMLFGDKSGLGNDVKTSLYRCGIGHAMAVSGMHLVLVTSVIAALIKKIRISGCCKFILIEISIILFVIFTGMSISVIRAAIMLTLIYGAAIFNRQTDTLNSLCIAFFVLTLPAPYLIKNSSFILSVAGTFGIGVFAPFVTKDMEEDTFLRRLKKKLAIMLCVSVAVFPLSVAYFDETSLIAPLSNILVIPVCVFVLFCGFAVAITGGTEIIAYPALMAGGLGSRFILKISEYVSSVPFTHIPLGFSYLPVIVILLSAFVVFTSLKFKKGNYTAMSILISCVVLCISSFVYRYLNRDIISVYRTGTQKAASVIIEHNGNSDIIDLTGGGKSAEYTSKILNRYGIHDINSITFIKNQYQSMSEYNMQLSFNNIKHVYVPYNTYIYDNLKVCGCIPEFTYTENLQYKYNDYSVVFENDGSVTIIYGKSQIKCSVDQITFSGCENIYTDTNTAVIADSRGNADIYSLE